MDYHYRHVWFDTRLYGNVQAENDQSQAEARQKRFVPLWQVEEIQALLWQGQLGKDPTMIAHIKKAQARSVKIHLDFENGTIGWHAINAMLADDFPKWEETIIPIDAEIIISDDPNRFGEFLPGKIYLLTDGDLRLTQVFPDDGTDPQQGEQLDVLIRRIATVPVAG